MSSIRSAVDRFCKLCRYDSSVYAKSWRQQVAECPEKTCHLWAVRPQVIKVSPWHKGILPPWRFLP